MNESFIHLALLWNNGQSEKETEEAEEAEAAGQCKKEEEETGQAKETEASKRNTQKSVLRRQM